TAVLLQVTLFAGGLDLVGDVGPAHTDEVVVLGLQAVIGILSEPCGFGHGSSFVSSCRQPVATAQARMGAGKVRSPGWLPMRPRRGGGNSHHSDLAAPVVNAIPR